MKTPRDSRSETTHLVMAGDTNQMGNLHGGTLMQWVDIIGAVAASRHAESIVTTAALDSMDFKMPVALGDIVTLYARVTWTGRSSMEVRVDVYKEHPICHRKSLTNTAYLVFVALDENRLPKSVPPFYPETEEEKVEYEQAIKRREMRLKR